MSLKLKSLIPISYFLSYLCPSFAKVVNMEFEGGLTAAFTMVAFTEEICRRKTTIYGSKVGKMWSNWKYKQHFKNRGSMGQQLASRRKKENLPNQWCVYVHDRDKGVIAVVVGQYCANFRGLFMLSANICWQKNQFSQFGMFADTAVWFCMSLYIMILWRSY